MTTKQDLINFETNIVDLYKKGHLPFLFHLSGGNEDPLIDIFGDIAPDDYVISSHRNHYHALLHGLDPNELTNKILNGRSMFIYDRSKNFFTSAIIGGTPAIAAGIALALKRKGSTQKVWCFVGDGTADTGHLFEAARYVDGFELPCQFIIEDNNRSVEASGWDRWNLSRVTQFPDCVSSYYYDITWPHARTTDMIDLKTCVPILGDDIYFPKVERYTPKQKYTYTNLNYKEAVSDSMQDIAKNNGVFIGYNVKYGHAFGALKNIDDDLKIETPVAENLMVGLAIGMSFEGYKPMVYFERQDFMTVATDAIVNHLNWIERLSHGEYKCPVILRSIVADSGPFYAGPVHSQNLTKGFSEMVDFPIYEPTTALQVCNAYNISLRSNQPSLIVEKKSCYAN